MNYLKLTLNSQKWPFSTVLTRLEKMEIQRYQKIAFLAQFMLCESVKQGYGSARRKAKANNPETQGQIPGLVL